jgi:hypothetical protein
MWYISFEKECGSEKSRDFEFCEKISLGGDKEREGYEGLQAQCRMLSLNNSI